MNCPDQHNCYLLCQSNCIPYVNGPRLSLYLWDIAVQVVKAIQQQSKWKLNSLLISMKIKCDGVSDRGPVMSPWVFWATVTDIAHCAGHWKMSRISWLYLQRFWVHDVQSIQLCSCGQESSLGQKFSQLHGVVFQANPWWWRWFIFEITLCYNQCFPV